MAGGRVVVRAAGSAGRGRAGRYLPDHQARSAGGASRRPGPPRSRVGWTSRRPRSRPRVRATLPGSGGCSPSGSSRPWAGAEPPAATRLRHKELLAEAAQRLRHALQQDEALELAAEDVRLAARALDRITGRIDPEAVLGRIFSTFCIGK
ncbi:hypothetical protein [Phenylobacterium sp. J426]|uniref:hypothetical protein n=1 Tax=Phenylobacterium sp. J426 TaxID=2898439 RepID=UPI0035B48BC5